MTTPNTPANGFSRRRKLVVLAASAAVTIVLVSLFLAVPRTDQPPNSPVTPVIGRSETTSGYYLPYQEKSSRIFVVAGNISYGTYPFQTRFSFGGPSSPPVVKEGEPCVIINVTVRNDYTAESPPPNPYPGDQAVAYVFLTAQLFHGGSEVNATDLTHVGAPPSSYSFVSLNGGEEETVSIYLATTSKDNITAFQITPVYIGGIPPP